MFSDELDRLISDYKGRKELLKSIMKGDIEKSNHLTG